MSEIVTTWVCVPGWVELTDSSPEWWAEEMVGKAVIYMGNESGRVLEAWVEDGGVKAHIELDPALWNEAWDNFVGSAIA